MAEAIIKCFRATLPEDLASSLEPYLRQLEDCEFDQLLDTPLAKQLLGRGENALTKDIELGDFGLWTDYIKHRLQLVLRDTEDTKAWSSGFKVHFMIILALASLGAFIQSNVTGPPLAFASTKLLFAETISLDDNQTKTIRKDIIDSLVEDGNAPYKLIPNVELFGLAKAITSSSTIADQATVGLWARQRVNFVHQRILSENATSLQSSILADIKSVALKLEHSSGLGIDNNLRASFNLEKASVELLHGLDQESRISIAAATRERDFKFVLTGMLGKRTKFQVKDVSQLVVLAKSAKKTSDVIDNQTNVASESKIAPTTVDLNDDTLLEKISFTTKSEPQAEIRSADEIPELLKDETAAREPLEPLDSAILLLTAASITNTSPDHGLTREETIPYASRVIDAGSSNWQVYTQALLIRSRIEGFKSRTVERGLLQLQALVDQVISETTSSEQSNGTTTFLPKATEKESAPNKERLQYVFQLGCPTRWELEAELAARWVNLGGLKTALEIYERLEMWPEVALCWAGTERDDKARQIVRRQLFHSASSDEASIDPDTDKWEGSARDPAPIDAPRLYCILGDLDKDPDMYEKAWQLSNSRYHRAQRSLGRYWYDQKDYTKAALAFSKAVKVRQLDHATWFALGCALLELNEFSRAVEIFSRTVQLDHEDAESWSNLAVALLNLDPESTEEVMPPIVPLDDEEPSDNTKSSGSDPSRHRREALQALKQAAKLKRDNFRIWDNILTVSASLNPPPYNDIIAAQRRVIELRGKVDGEKCVDEKILQKLIDHITSTSKDGDPNNDPDKPGLARMICELVDRNIVPLITSSFALWESVALLAIWRNKPSTALDAREKAWRCITIQPGWEHGKEAQWNAVVTATLNVVQAYKDLGPQEKTEGMAAGSGELVMKDWKFKARSAIRGILGKGKASWEDTDEWVKLKDAGEDLKS